MKLNDFFMKNKFLNKKEICRRAGLNYNIIYAKFYKERELTLQEQEKLDNIIKQIIKELEADEHVG